jgi:hypothetical protein
MQPFEYLSVMTSVVLGLGIAHLLADLTRLIEGRERVKLYWVSALWAVTLLMQHLQMWWVLFGYRNLASWNFFSFLLLFVPAMLLYTVTVLLLPEFDPKDGIDLEQHYYRNHKWFYSLAALTLVLLSIRAVVLRGLPAADGAGLARHMATALFVVAAVTHSRKYHAAVALIAFLLFLVVLVRFTLVLT